MGNAMQLDAGQIEGVSGSAAAGVSRLILVQRNGEWEEEGVTDP